MERRYFCKIRHLCKKPDHGLCETTAVRQWSEILREVNSNLCPDPKEKYYSHKEEMKIDDLFQFPWGLQMHIFIPNLILCTIYKIKLGGDEINIETSAWDLISLIPFSYPLVVETELISFKKLFCIFWSGRIKLN